MSCGECAECGAPTEWDDDAGSAICIECGTLADATQSVLTTQYDPGSRPTTDTTLSLKGRKGWTFAGQSREASHTRNKLAIHEFIQTLAARLSARGAAERAQTLFDQAMTRGQFRWGRQAKRMAGAAFAVALRELKRSDALRDIAYLLEESPETLGRAFSSLTRLLGLKVAPADPTVHLSALRNHLVSLLQDSPSTFPDKLKVTLLPLLPRTMTIMRTADSLCALLSRIDSLIKIPTPPTACAVLMLALEAEIQTSMPHTGVLAHIFGTRFNVAKTTVMQRYKVIYDLVEEWIREVPWLDAHERKNGGTGRSKVAKRVVVARGLKDVLQFQEEIWVKRLEAQTMPRLDLEVEGAGADEEEVAERDSDADEQWRYFQDSRRGDSAAGTSFASTHAPRKDVVTSRPPPKKWKSAHEHSVVRASQFLLNPLRCASGTQRTPPRLRKRSGPADLDLLSHILTADASNLPHVFANAPSRLQLLAASRARAESDIPDEELFADGELDGLLRSTEEAGQLRTALGWDVEVEEEVPPEKPQRKRKRGADEGQERTRGTKRIDMDALARLLDPSRDVEAAYALGDNDDLKDDEEEDYAADERGGYRSPSCLGDEEDAYMSSRPPLTGGEGETVEEWRPMSPGIGYDDDRYDF